MSASLIARRCAKAGALSALGLALASAAAAQPGYDRYDDDPNTVSGVVVIAPRHIERDSATGAPIERVSASRVVRYGDLDLSRRWGVRELHARVERAARSACDELDRAYPLTDPDTLTCVRAAVQEAMYQIPSDD